MGRRKKIADNMTKLAKTIGRNSKNIKNADAAETFAWDLESVATAKTKEELLQSIVKSSNPAEMSRALSESGFKSLAGVVDSAVAKDVFKSSPEMIKKLEATFPHEAIADKEMFSTLQDSFTKLGSSNPTDVVAAVS